MDHWSISISEWVMHKIGNNDKGPKLSLVHTPPHLAVIQSLRLNDNLQIFALLRIVSLMSRVGRMTSFSALHSAISRSPNTNGGQISGRPSTFGSTQSSTIGSRSKSGSMLSSIGATVHMQDFPSLDPDGEPRRCLDLPMAENDCQSSALHESLVSGFPAKRFCWSPMGIKLSSYDIPSRNILVDDATSVLRSKISASGRGVELITVMKNAIMRSTLGRTENIILFEDLEPLQSRGSFVMITLS